ncbi:hypothetical protein [Streptomyces alanosinicus]|uniref:Uncharacterized protein n=1 Tax=Streptomyces alanosinicus TaxID=68171 RepID=A0A919D6W5_9ACTN|nr:hypothetical protein [Streptomyces alanosinicus]GHE09642.1 hypothetical protein GCM10010339_62680 [Streptomyces alanosinicus]
MGVGIEVLIVDWPRVEAAQPGDREELLVDAAFGEAYSDGLFEHGWSWSTHPGEDWYGRYALRNTLGSYKPHFWAGHRWDHMRDLVEPRARDVVDRVAPQLEVLREPFTQHAAESSGWIRSFESFADFLTDWGEVVTEAERRGWGIVGLRC